MTRDRLPAVIVFQPMQNYGSFPGAIVLAALLGCSTVGAHNQAVGDPATNAVANRVASTPADFAEFEARIIDLVNAERRQAGLSAVARNAALDRAARVHASNMATLQRMAHTLPGTEQPDMVTRAIYAGYEFARLTENVAFGYPSAEEVLSGWLASPGHRKNILDAEVAESGVAIARAANGELYFCQVFGGPPQP